MAGSWDHPRSRGEYEPVSPGRGSGSGSSPLSRGIHRSRGRRRRQGGIIPALAGNTYCDHGYTWRPSDHPRSRGEYCSRILRSSCPKGSSPLSRGILVSAQYLVYGGGIIPALAGNTSTFPLSEDRKTDHPRSRGEYRSSATCRHASRGSSPLSRGIRDRRGGGSRLVRIIPALAGNTVAGTDHDGNATDHPRSRGEYPDPAQAGYGTTGSSPLSRGILDAGRATVVRNGIIPALAGNTCAAGDRRAASSDHPRSRGEYRIPDGPCKAFQGSSPLSRGIP